MSRRLLETFRLMDRRREGNEHQEMLKKPIGLRARRVLVGSARTSLFLVSN